jgi:hypothetical protein
MATGPKKLSLEQGADIGVIAFLDGGTVAVASVVDQYVDAAERLLGLANRVGDLPRIGDV